MSESLEMSWIRCPQPKPQRSSLEHRSFGVASIVNCLEAKQMPNSIAKRPTCQEDCSPKQLLYRSFRMHGSLLCFAASCMKEYHIWCSPVSGHAHIQWDVQAVLCSSGNSHPSQVQACPNGLGLRYLDASVVIVWFAHSLAWTPKPETLNPKP